MSLAPDSSSLCLYPSRKLQETQESMASRLEEAERKAQSLQTGNDPLARAASANDRHAFTGSSRLTARVQQGALSRPLVVSYTQGRPR